MTLKVSGLDLSLTATGVAVFRAGEGVSVYQIRPGDKLRGNERLLYLRRSICSLTAGSTHIVIEGAAYARPQGQHKLGGLWWLIEHCVWMQNPKAQIVVVDPRARIQYALGKRSGDKDQVMARAIKVYPMVDITDNNTADATVLVAMCLDVLGEPLAVVPQTHRAALDKWPYKSVEEL